MYENDFGKHISATLYNMASIYSYTRYKPHGLVQNLGRTNSKILNLRASILYSACGSEGMARV
jgi:hypothetical protein